MYIYKYACIQRERERKREKGAVGGRLSGAGQLGGEGYHVCVCVYVYVYVCVCDIQIHTHTHTHNTTHANARTHAGAVGGRLSATGQLGGEGVSLPCLGEGTGAQASSALGRASTVAGVYVCVCMMM